MRERETDALNTPRGIGFGILGGLVLWAVLSAALCAPILLR